MPSYSSFMLAATATLLLAGSSVANGQVIIGGAGYAGVTAAHELAKRGVDFIILEASDRVGGRMKKFEFGEDAHGDPYILEAGANWIQGTMENPVWAAKKKYKLEGEAQNWDDATVYDQDGVMDPAPWAPGTISLLADEAFVGAGEISRKCIQPKAGENVPTSWLAFCKEVFGDEFTLGSVSDVSSAEAETLFNGFSADVSPLARIYQYFSHDFEFAESPDITSVNMSLPSNTYGDFKDADLFVLDDRGYEWLVQKTAAEFIETSSNFNPKKEVVFDDPDHLQLNTKITHVQWSSDASDEVEITVCDTEASGSSSLTMFDCLPGTSRVIVGDYFIPTFSLGVLQQSIADEENASVDVDSAPQFSPSFPAEMKEAINEYPMALYSKLFFQFKPEIEKFWDDTSMMLSAYSVDDDIATYAPVWQSLDMPNKNKWLPGSKIFFLTLTGERAKQVHQASVSDEDIVEQILPVLNQIFEETLMANLGRLLLPSDVNAFSMTRWLQDPLFRGSYTNWRPNRTWEQQEEYRVQRGNLWMSGEGVCFRYFGYVHAALLGGQRTALRLLKEEFGFTEIDTESICDVAHTSGNSANSPGHVLHGRGYPGSERNLE